MGLHLTKIKEAQAEAFTKRGTFLSRTTFSSDQALKVTSLHLIRRSGISFKLKLRKKHLLAVLFSLL